MENCRNTPLYNYLIMCLRVTLFALRFLVCCIDMANKLIDIAQFHRSVMVVALNHVADSIKNDFVFVCLFHTLHTDDLVKLVEGDDDVADEVHLGFGLGCLHNQGAIQLDDAEGVLK